MAGCLLADLPPPGIVAIERLLNRRGAKAIYHFSQPSLIEYPLGGQAKRLSIGNGQQQAATRLEDAPQFVDRQQRIARALLAMSHLPGVAAVVQPDVLQRREANDRRSS